jgi:hypothetical protein
MYIGSGSLSLVKRGVSPVHRVRVGAPSFLCSGPLLLELIGHNTKESVLLEGLSLRTGPLGWEPFFFLGRKTAGQTCVK